MLYTQEASAKSSHHREKELLTKKLEKKKEKLKHTLSTLETTIKQLDQLRSDNANLGQVIVKLKEHMQRQPDGGRTSDLLF